MAEPEESLEANAKTTAEQIKNILGLSGVKHARRWQELQVSILRIDDQIIDQYCFRDLRTRCARNSSRPSCNGRNFQASRLTKLATPWKIEIHYWKDGLISLIGLSQSIKDRRVTYMCVESLVCYAKLKDALASKIGKIVRT